MYNFSVHANNAVAASLEEKIRFCGELRINNMEMDETLGGMSVADLDGVELECWRNLLIEHNKKIVLLNCSRPISDTGYYRRLFRKAHMLGVENLKIDACCFDADLLNCMEDWNAIVRTGFSYGIQVLVENDSRSCLREEKALAILLKVRQGAGWVFNPLEFARCRVHPFFHVFYNSRLKNSICFLRVNDGLFVDGSPALPGEGNAEIKEMASALLARSFKGYFSFVPYMSDACLDTYKSIIRKFKKLLSTL